MLKVWKSYKGFEFLLDEQDKELSILSPKGDCMPDERFASISETRIIKKELKKTWERKIIPYLISKGYTYVTCAPISRSRCRMFKKFGFESHGAYHFMTFKVPKKEVIVFDHRQFLYF